MIYLENLIKSRSNHPRTSHHITTWHCSAQPYSSFLLTEEDTRISQAPRLRRWHLDMGYVDIGYDFVIERNGQIKTGRSLSQVGAHEQLVNRRGISVCYVGGVNDSFEPLDTRTIPQILAMIYIRDSLNNIDENWVHYGHNDFDKNRDCPSFEVDERLNELDRDLLLREALFDEIIASRNVTINNVLIRGGVSDPKLDSHLRKSIENIDFSFLDVKDLINLKSTYGSKNYLSMLIKTSAFIETCSS